eukprot:NODE_211_length_14581_cov_0.368941.p5 type:complete len:178 gc:universal NODE_211_length_14581_cov_0.368941:9534-10067(+)
MKPNLPSNRSDILLVVLHPHPYLGGCPANNVVELFKDLPFILYTPQLRGLFAECELKRIKKRIREINHQKCYIIGYSYGSLVASLLARDIICDKLILISIPYSVSFLCTMKSSEIKEFIKSTKIPLRIIHGDGDQFASSEKILDNFNNVTIMSKVDHFWFYKEKELLEIVSHFLLNE